MRRLVATTILSTSLLPAIASADVGGSHTDTAVPPPPDVTADGDITVQVNYTDVVYSFGGSGGPVCRWTQFTVGEYETFFDLYVEPDPLPPLPEVPELPTDREPTPEEIAEYDRLVAEREAEIERRRLAAERERIRLSQPAVIQLTQLGEIVDHRVFGTDCPGEGFDVRFIAVTTDEGGLLANVEDIAHGRIPEATPDISPSAEAGGVVNLGMWLAVEPPPEIGNITAEAGPVWVTVSPRHTNTTFGFGNGDSVTCDGVGDPIEDTHPDLDVVDESPICGYTYDRSSADDEPYRLDIGMTWTLPYTSSAGTGTLPPFTRTTTLDYDVDEVQTVGTR